MPKKPPMMAIRQGAKPKSLGAGGGEVRQRRIDESVLSDDVQVVKPPTVVDHVRQVFARRRPAIQEIVREPTAGGVIFRYSKDGKDIEILLIQDAKDRWTIPKGHIEPGETAKQTAVREIGEESGLKEVEVVGWLGKIHFKYRRMETLVLMTTQVYLVKALGDTDEVRKEAWMNGIKWMKFSEAFDAIEYEDIGKLMLLAKKRIRQGKL